MWRMLTAVMNNVAEWNHDMVLISSQNPHNKAHLLSKDSSSFLPSAWEVFSEPLNFSTSARSSSQLRSPWKISGPAHQQKKTSSSQTLPYHPCVQVVEFCSVYQELSWQAEGDWPCAACTVPGVVHLPTALLCNLLQEVKHTLNTGILSYFVHAQRRIYHVYPPVFLPRPLPCASSLPTQPFHKTEQAT